MKQYLDLARNILNHGGHRPPAREGQPGTRSLFGYMMIFDLAKGFPMVTTRAISFKTVAVETLWMLKGRTDLSYLHEHGVHIWDQWVKCDGTIGPGYGRQWRTWPVWDGCSYAARFEPRDQILALIQGLKDQPYSRRHLVSAWNLSELDEMALPPCHYSFQMYVNQGRLSCLVNMRSSDVPVGLPHNIAGYALLTHLVAHVTDLVPAELVFSLGDAHVYEDQIPALESQLRREPRPLPHLGALPKVTCIDDFTLADLRLNGYDPHPKIAYPVAK